MYWKEFCVDRVEVVWFFLFSRAVNGGRKKEEGNNKWRFARQRIDDEKQLTWYQVLTWSCVSPRILAKSDLSGVDRYFWESNLLSSPINCNSVNTVRFRLIFRFWLLLSPTPPLLPSSSSSSSSSSSLWSRSWLYSSWPWFDFEWHPITSFCSCWWQGCGNDLSEEEEVQLDLIETTVEWLLLHLLLLLLQWLLLLLLLECRKLAGNKLEEEEVKLMW